MEEVRDILALVEADLDFSDQDIEAAPAEAIARRIGAARAALSALGRRSRGLETFGGEVRLVIAGRPNAGKSSLFNRLLAESGGAGAAGGAGAGGGRAIVAPEAGTTRDELHGTSGGRPGVRALGHGGAGRGGRRAGGEGEGPGAGGDRAGGPRAGGDGRDGAVARVDGGGHRAGNVADGGRDDEVRPGVAGAGREWLASRGVRAEVVATSAVTGEGMAALGEALVRAVEGGEVDRQAAGPVVTARHRSALERAAVALARAHRLARRPEVPGELVAVELGEALGTLGTIVGRNVDGNVLGDIFSRFCIGK